MSFLRRLAAAMCCGFLFCFYSERIFWSRWPEENIPFELVATWIAYSILAYIFLSVVALFRVRDFWGVFLGGAMFGWLGEGVLVDTTYWDPIWVHLSWTGLAWHALLTVGVGWFAMGRSLRAGRIGRVLMLSVLTGVFWGCWAAYWPREGVKIDLLDFSTHCLAMTGALIIAQGIYHAVTPRQVCPSMAELLVLGLIVAAWFVMVRMPASPRAIYVLPPLVLLTLASLSIGRRRKAAGSDVEVLQQMRGPVRPACYLAMAAIAPSAIGIVAIATQWQIWPPTNMVVLIVTGPLGYIFFAVAIYRQWRRVPKAVSAQETAPSAH
jgi:hypothetical protein